MPQRHRGPLPVPTQDLVRIQGELDPYGSTLWEGAELKVLVARVPDADPDLVNGLERIVESAAPAHVESAHGALVLTPKDVHVVPLDPMRALMAERVAFDARNAARLRAEIPTTSGVRVWRGVDDPKRRLRMTIRIAQERVADLDDHDLLDAAEELGDRLGALDDLHCVYIVASTDHVRLAPGQILGELQERWNDPARRERVEMEQLAAQQEAEAERLLAKELLEQELRGRMTRTAVAPVRTMETTRTPDMDRIHRRIDGMGAEPEPEMRERTVEPEPRGPVRIGVRETTARDQLIDRLRALGYAVRNDPLPGIDLAAERGRFPHRILAVVADEAGHRHVAALEDARSRYGVDTALLVADAIGSVVARDLERSPVESLHPSDIPRMVLG